MNETNAQAETIEPEVAQVPDVDTSVDCIGTYRGKQITELPKDLYIPPDALEVFLEHFEGPLDLLLYLIRRENLDILDIPIVKITDQYMKYIDLMHEMRFELAAEYLVMAAMLAEIKSRMLLPRPAVEEEDDLDPRAELVRRLQEYERFKQAAEDFNELTWFGRDTFIANADIEIVNTDDKPLPKIDLEQLLHAFNEVLIRADLYTHHHIQMEALSVRERMSRVLEAVQSNEFVEFTTLFDFTEGRMGVVVTFLAILELIKEKLLELVQSEPFAQIHIKTKSSVLESELDEDWVDLKSEQSAGVSDEAVIEGDSTFDSNNVETAESDNVQHLVSQDAILDSGESSYEVTDNSEIVESKVKLDDDEPHSVH